VSGHAENDDCLHCLIMRMILDRAKERRAAGIKHDMVEDVARVTEVLGQLLGTVPDDGERKELMDAMLDLLARVFHDAEQKTRVIVAMRNSMSQAEVKH
jgi:hypothetical protein